MITSKKKTNSFAAVVRFPRWRRTCVERGKKKRGTWKKKRGTWLFAEIPLNGPHLHFQFSFLAAVSNDSVTHLISRRYALRPRLLTGFRWDPPFCFSFSFFFSSLYSFLFSRFFPRSVSAWAFQRRVLIVSIPIFFLGGGVGEGFTGVGFNFGNIYWVFVGSDWLWWVWVGLVGLDWVSRTFNGIYWVLPGFFTGSSRVY